MTNLVNFLLLLYFYVYIVVIKLPLLSMAISFEESKTHLHQALRNIFYSEVKNHKTIHAIANTTKQENITIAVKIQSPEKSHAEQYKMYMRRNYFAICLAVRDDPDIVEWIEYHWRKGCSKFYIYDNYSNPPLSDLIRQYIDKGIVEYVYSVEEMKPSPQMYIYNQCFSKHKRKHRFIGFIDTDEFIVTANPSASIPLVLSQYEQFGGLALSWMSFGSSGHIRRPAGGVIANYRWCFPNRHIKSIVNTRYTLGPSLNSHAFNFIGEFSYCIYTVYGMDFAITL